MEVALAHHDYGVVVRHPLDAVTPSPREFERRLHRFDAGVHRQHPVLADKFRQGLQERPELVVVECPRGERQAVQL